jgi:hypothetical protein
LVAQYWFLLLDSLVQFEGDDFVECGAEEVLMPGQVLVDLRTLLDVRAVVLAQLVGVLFAEIDEDSAALCEFEVAVDQEGDLSQRIQTEVLFGFVLVLHHVYSH